jgi:hypothetical protein
VAWIICDLDGCLTDDRRRRVHLPDYDAYHEGLGEDKVNEVLRAKMRGLNGTLLFMSARPEKYRAETVHWLARYGYEDYVLLMRPDGSKAPSPVLKYNMLNDWLGGDWSDVLVAFDDREDVLAVYPCPTELVKLPETVPDILERMADTFRERNAVYASNYKLVAPIVKVLWPDGPPAAITLDDKWHLFELLLVKVTRFATSGLTHVDTIHDAAVYAAMLESIITGGDA